MERIAPEDVGLSARRLERIYPAMQRYVDDGQIPGLFGFTLASVNIINA